MLSPAAKPSARLRRPAPALPGNGTSLRPPTSQYNRTRSKALLIQLPIVLPVDRNAAANSYTAATIRNVDIIYPFAVNTIPEGVLPKGGIRRAGDSPTCIVYRADRWGRQDWGWERPRSLRHRGRQCSNGDHGLGAFFHLCLLSRLILILASHRPYY